MKTVLWQFGFMVVSPILHTGCLFLLSEEKPRHNRFATPVFALAIFKNGS